MYIFVDVNLARGGGGARGVKWGGGGEGKGGHFGPNFSCRHL